MTNEEPSVIDDTIEEYVEPHIVMLPLTSFVRANYRYEGESHEDYKTSMKIQHRIRKLLKRYGSQFKLGYEPDTNTIHWSRGT